MIGAFGRCKNAMTLRQTNARNPLSVRLALPCVAGLRGGKKDAAGWGPRPSEP